MSTIKTQDGVEIFYKDCRSGRPIVFSLGWPLSRDDWDAQLMFLLLVHDRRGHGRSSQTADGHNLDHYVDDLAALTAHRGGPIYGINRSGAQVDDGVIRNGWRQGMMAGIKAH
jgi:non-heme chloroperoxidase